ncbi:hypothetical protein GQ457_08G026920 [Hibiscus cannabinus]
MKPLLEDVVYKLAHNVEQFQQETRPSIKNLETQVSQIVSSLSQFEYKGMLPSQTIMNTKQNVNSITLRSGRNFQDFPTKDDAKKERGKASKLIFWEPLFSEKDGKSHRPGQEKGDVDISQVTRPIVVQPPFPQRFSKTKKEEDEKEILETFCEVEVNITLIDDIKQIPCFAKFLIEFCTNKRKLNGNENVRVG